MSSKKKSGKASPSGSRRSQRIADRNRRKNGNGNNNNSMELDNDNNNNDLEMKEPQNQQQPNPPPHPEEKELKEHKDNNNPGSDANNNRRPGNPKAPEPEDSVPVNAHDERGIRDMIRGYHSVLRAHGATIRTKNLIENEMVNWSEYGILKWVTNNMPAAVPMVERGAGKFAKVELVMHGFMAANKVTLKIIDELRDGLIGMGVSEDHLGIPDDVFVDDEGKSKGKGKENVDGGDDDRAMTPKEGSQSQYRPPGDKAKSKKKGKVARRKKVKVTKNTTYVDGAVKNVEKKAGDDTEDDSDDDMDANEKLKVLKQKVARQDAELKKLKEKEKEKKKKKDNDELKADPAVLAALNKEYGNRGKKVSYSGVIVILFFSLCFFFFFVSWELKCDALNSLGAPAGGVSTERLCCEQHGVAAMAFERW